MEQFPRRVAQPEEGRAVGFDQKSFVITHLQPAGGLLLRLTESAQANGDDESCENQGSNGGSHDSSLRFEFFYCWLRLNLKVKIALEAIKAQETIRRIAVTDIELRVNQQAYE
jgi:hypothetical protein